MLKKYLRTYKVFVENAFSYEAQYRQETFMKLFTNLLYIWMLFVIIDVIFNRTTNIAGWTKEYIYLMSVLWVIMDELFIFLFRENFFNLSLRMNKGDLDVILTKPINPLFYSTTKQLLSRAFYRFILQLFILWFVIIHYKIQFTLIGFLLVIPLLLIGIWIIYSLSLIGNTLSFWLIKIDNVNDAVSTVNTLGRFPLNLWPRTLKIIFLSAIPIAFTAYIPVATLTGRWPWYGILYAFLFAGLLFYIAVKFWNFALRRYSSASS